VKGAVNGIDIFPLAIARRLKCATFGPWLATCALARRVGRTGKTSSVSELLARGKARQHLECVELAPAFSRLRAIKNAKAPARSLQTAKAHSKRFAPFFAPAISTTPLAHAERQLKHERIVHDMKGRSMSSPYFPWHSPTLKVRYVRPMACDLRIGTASWTDR
jgi:hypothetical protein